jgi:hypothetical protein
LKGAIKASIVPEIWKHVTEFDILIEINELIFTTIDGLALEILVRQELDKINMDLESGKIKFIKPDVFTFSGIIKKFGLDNVARANNLVNLMNDQQEDAAAETFFENKK